MERRDTGARERERGGVHVRVHVVINPGSGQPQPVLHTLNSVFGAAGVEWEATITHKSGDARGQARDAAAAGVDVVVAYGGDGTVMEVAEGVAGTAALLGVLPGGTANLMAHELGVAVGIDKAAQVIVDPASKRVPVDLGCANGKHYILRCGAGWGARQVADATRELKDRWGVLAYTFGKVKAWGESDVVTYVVTIDDVVHEFEAFSVSVVNAGNVGLGPLRLAKQISVSDGLLDLLVLRGKGVKAFGELSGAIAGLPSGEEVEHAQGRKFRIEASPAQPVQLDGEIFGETPLDIEVVPGALTAIVPAT
jgi:diacylglycerol kinase (ATP)